MSEFKGAAGTIYINDKPNSADAMYDVWFEDFCILGQGRTKIDALRDAARQVAQMATLIAEAVVITSADEETERQETSDGSTDIS